MIYFTYRRNRGTDIKQQAQRPWVYSWHIASIALYNKSRSITNLTRHLFPTIILIVVYKTSIQQANPLFSSKKKTSPITLPSRPR